MPSVTRQRIKAIEGYRRSIQPRSLSGLGDWTDILTGSKNTPPINGTNTNQQVKMEDFIDFLTGKIGQTRIEATQFAEGMVKLMYGLEGSCALPPPNIPVVAGANPPKFCANSIAGAIERCKLYEAQNTLSFLTQQLTMRAAAQDATGPFIKRWYDQYGRNDITILTGIITASRGTCGVTGTIPSITNCPAGTAYNIVQGRCVEGTPGGGSINTGLSPTMIAAGLGLLALVLVMKKR